jgi:hypothetical protein
VDYSAVANTVSFRRLVRYREAVGGDLAGSIELYIWNLKVSAAFLPALGLAEVAIRNAFDRELRNRFGPTWFETDAFVKQLPDYWRAKFRKVIDDQRKRRGRILTADDIVAELNFAFWVHLSTPKVERSVWARVFPQVFPGAPSDLSTFELHARLERMRLLRNRIAHHEPIFARRLAVDFGNIRDLLMWRCGSTCELLDAISVLHHELATCPVPVARLINP